LIKPDSRSDLSPVLALGSSVRERRALALKDPGNRRLHLRIARTANSVAVLVAGQPRRSMSSLAASATSMSVPWQLSTVMELQVPNR
jgi:hypothetical protein